MMETPVGFFSKPKYSLNKKYTFNVCLNLFSARCLGDMCGEIHCAGHTATLVENRMMVMFGHSPKYGFLDTVQVVMFGNRLVENIDTI